VNVEQAPAEPVAVQAPTSPEEPPPAAEAIAACGTAMVMPEGGELADAVPSHEASEESPSAAEPTPQPVASTEEGDAASAEEPPATSDPSEASVTATSEAAPPSDTEPQTPEREGATEQIASVASCSEEASSNDEALPVEKVDAVAAEAMQASPIPRATEEAVAVADPPEVSH
jgi:hypothetical protein